MVAGSHQVSSHDHWCTSSTWEPSRRGSTLRNLTTSAFWSKFWSAADSLVYSYRRSFTGFAAKLTHQEQQKIASMESVVSVLESKIYKLHTTRSWDFMGFPDTVRRNLTVESDVIIGMFDTGVWPESESFSHVVLGPPPKRWKGTCQSSGNFSCNNKLIGARLYLNLPSPNDSAREVEGHGTHTASTAAGREVNGVSLFGLTEGNARGAVPSARIAVYKVCWSNGSAFHIVSWLHSMMPLPMASTLSLFLWAQKLRLGNGQTFLGSTVNTFKSGGKMHPLIYGEDAARSCDEEKAQSCFDGCLDEKAVKGKIVFCDAV